MIHQLLLICLRIGLSLSRSIAETERSSDTEVGKFMRSMDVIPDVIEVGPQDFLNITYHGYVKVDRGKELEPIQVRDEPEVTWPASPDGYYTLIMIDPDMPNAIHPVDREFLHWMVVNIPGNLVSLGDVRVGYVGPTPLQGSGSHRYVTLLYKQKEYTKFDFKRLPKHVLDGRTGFRATAFAKKYKFGYPVAGNFFTASWSTDVPQLIKTLKVHTVSDWH
ncbi:hypothetical protein KR026_002961 [Drosophila bipectinata]|nr:hypothetical protein KR026_002961 [Drosophila bipectinata]